ncbi:DUF4055 domain-containing protein [Microbaculum marinum]|uniref:DUF4055 domain-containing protein n=1 Tax=Microbaculum marinum TaxID=1764581 RepID=A0AAW9RUM1_9HYPH
MPITFKPDSRHPTYVKWLPTWQKMRDCYDGDDAIREKKTDYLPMPSGMMAAPDPDRFYLAYQTRAQIPELMEPAVRGMTGVIHRKPSQYKLPSGIKGLEEKATKDRQTLAGFHARITREVFKVGRVGILADAPKDGGEVYLTNYTAESIIDWDEDEDGNLNYLVLDESAQRRNPEKGEWEDVGRWRVLELIEGIYTQTIYEQAQGASEPITVDAPITPADSKGAALSEIPFVCVGANEIGIDPDEAPLEGVAKAQLSIFRLDADRRHSLYLTSQPTPVCIGVDDEDKVPKYFGSSVVWNLPQGGDAKMLEFSGNGVAAIKQAIDDDFERAVAAGARLIVTDRQGGVESGEALERVLRYAEMMTGGDGKQAVVTPNTDFVEAKLTPDDVTKLVKGWLDGGYSKLTLFENLQTGGIIPEERTFADEEELISQEAPDLSVPPPGGEEDDDEIDDATGGGEEDETGDQAA